MSYYAVIFTSRLAKSDKAYSEAAARMEELARNEPGFLGIESAREIIGISVSYWKDMDSIKAWKANAEHLEAQLRGKTEWYEWYKVRIAKVDNEYSNP